VNDKEEMFEDGDPLNDPAWQGGGKSKRRGQQKEPHIGCPIAWLRWVWPLMRSPEQLVLALLLYRRCVLCNSATIDVPGRDVEKLGLSRHTKRHRLYRFEQLGILCVQERQTGRAMRVTILYWPDPPPPGWVPPNGR